MPQNGRHRLFGFCPGRRATRNRGARLLAAAAQTSLYVLRIDTSQWLRPTPDARRLSLRSDAATGRVELLASVAKGKCSMSLAPACRPSSASNELSGYYLVGVESTRVRHRWQGASNQRPGVAARRNRSRAARAGACGCRRRRHAAPARGSCCRTELATGGPGPSAARRHASAPRSERSRIQLLIHADLVRRTLSAQDVSLGYVISDSKGTVVVNRAATGKLPPAVGGAPSPLVFPATRCSIRVNHAEARHRGGCSRGVGRTSGPCEPD